MIHLYSALGVTVLVLVAAGLAVRDSLRQTRPVIAADMSLQELPAPVDAPSPYRLGCMLLVLILAMIAPLPPGPVYKAGIIFALLVLMMTEVFMAIPGTPRILRTGSNVAIYFVLWVTFASATGISFWSWWALLALIPLGLGALYFLPLRSQVDFLQITVLTYMANCALVLSFALTLFATHFALWSLAALLGGLALVGADLLEGWNRFRTPVVRLDLWQMTLYLLGALLLAWSVWGYPFPLM